MRPPLPARHACAVFLSFNGDDHEAMLSKEEDFRIVSRTRVTAVKESRLWLEGFDNEGLRRDFSRLFSMNLKSLIFFTGTKPKILVEKLVLYFSFLSVQSIALIYDLEL